jgi:hypothetical protein
MWHSTYTLGMTITNQNLIQEEINMRLNLGNACYHSVQNILSSTLLSKNIKIRILPVDLYGCEIWSLTLREEHRLRVFENRVLRRIFGPKRNEVTGGWRKLHNEELYNLYSSPSIMRMIKSRRMRWTGHVTRSETEEEKDLNPHTHCYEDLRYHKNYGFLLVVFVDIKRTSLKNVVMSTPA